MQTMCEQTVWRIVHWNGGTKKGICIGRYNDNTIGVNTELIRVQCTDVRSMEYKFWFITYKRTQARMRMHVCVGSYEQIVFRLSSTFFIFSVCTLCIVVCDIGVIYFRSHTPLNSAIRVCVCVCARCELSKIESAMPYTYACACMHVCMYAQMYGRHFYNSRSYSQIYILYYTHYSIFLLPSTTAHTFVNLNVIQTLSRLWKRTNILKK